MVTKTVRAPVEPAVLVWARKSIGYDVPDAAARLAIKPERLTEFESGARQPSLPQLRKMAKVYGRPLAVLLLDQQPQGWDAMHDFRRMPDAEAREWSPALHKAFRKALGQQEVAAELQEESGQPASGWVLPAADLANEPEMVAGDTRDVLGVSLADQFQWGRKDVNAPLRGWTVAVEEQGVLVLQARRVESSEMRGFSITSGPMPVVVLNGTESPRGRVFTLAHELGHIVMRQGGLCDLHDELGRTSAPDRDAEVWCNAFAAALLMPRDAFLREPGVSSATSPREWSDQELRELSRRYGTSNEAVLRRLVTLGRATVAYYQTRRDEFLSAYEADRARRRAEGSGFADPAVMAVNDLGRSYVRLVLDAWGDGSISASELSDYLDVRLKHVPRIVELVRAS